MVLFGQKFKQERYKNFDRRLFHFGFMLGFNSSDFTLYPVQNAYEQFKILNVQNDAQPGGQLGILTTMRLGTPMIRLRFVPTISFLERSIKSIDLQSQEKASQNFIDPFIKIKRFDWQGQIGGGLEFFAPYFKFGVELKFTHGFSNAFIKDNTYIAAPIQTLYNRGWFVSFIFEG